MVIIVIIFRMIRTIHPLRRSFSLDLAADDSNTLFLPLHANDDNHHNSHHISHHIFAKSVRNHIFLVQISFFNLIFNHHFIQLFPYFIPLFIKSNINLYSSLNYITINNKNQLKNTEQGESNHFN